MTDELLTWLRAQLDEDENTAKAVTHESWWLDQAAWTAWTELDPQAAAHAQRHNPATVLADIDAKRQILDGLPPQHWAVRLLALPYADQPGYRDEWRP